MDVWMSKNGGYDWTRVRFLIFMTIRGKKCIPCVTHRLACIFYVEISRWMMRLQRGLTCSLSLYRRVSVTLRLVHVSDSLVCVSKRQVLHFLYVFLLDYFTCTIFQLTTCNNKIICIELKKNSQKNFN